MHKTATGSVLILILAPLVLAVIGCEGAPSRPAPVANAPQPAAGTSEAAGQNSEPSDASAKPTPATTQPVTSPAVAGAKTGVARQPAARKFTFYYRFRVKDLPVAAEAEREVVRVWLPCASTTECQQVERLPATAPAELSEHTESRFGNKLLYLETPAPEDGVFSVEIPYSVVRHEVLTDGGAAGPAEKLDEGLRRRFLAADTLVPTTGKPLTMLEAATLPMEPLFLARRLYEIVDEHVVYKKEGTGWGRGDSSWVCDSGYGNCTDFHSLFISLARSQGLPARFEIGFSIPIDTSAGPIAGYHCWAWFYVDGRGWIPVDISEADKHPELKQYYFGNLTADRVMFSVGRDLELVPKSAEPPLNFHIYPHIEVGGRPLPKEHIELQFSFADESAK